MNNSDNSATPNPARECSLTLQLRGYLTPSLNRLLGQHWTTLQKEKVRARRALDSALKENPFAYLMQTTTQEVASRSLTNSATRNSSQTTIQKVSKSSSGKSKSKRRPKK